MNEPTGLMLSNSAAAAKLAAAFWLTHMAIILLRRGATVPRLANQPIDLDCCREHYCLASRCAHGLVHRVPVGAHHAHRWLEAMDERLRIKPSTAQKRLPLIAITLSITGCALCTYALAVAEKAGRLGGQPNAMMVASLLSMFVLFALLVASTLELTFGALGSELLALPWSRISMIATLAFLIEILLAGWLVARLKPSESVEMTAAPVLYAFSRLLLGYIAWCVPRRMALLAHKKKLDGQASLALAGWIGLICFAVAMALPTAWPWNM